MKLKVSAPYKLGIIKPKEADSYIRYLNDLKAITELNSKVDNYKKKYTQTEVLSIMNYICYGTKLGFKVKKKDIVKETCLVEITIVEGRNHIVKNI